MNKVYLIGNLTRDPEMRSTSTGIPVCNFSIAVNRRFKNAQTGQQETDFFNIVAWRQLADLCGRYLTKGRKVAVQGRIKTGSYKKDGVTHYTTDVWANNVEFLSKKNKLATVIYSVIAIAFIFLGTLLKNDLVWELTDFFNYLMVLPNAIALLALGKIVAKNAKNK